MNIAINYLEEFMARGESVAQMVMDRKLDQIKEAMSEEIVEANVDISGKKLN